MTVPSLLDLCIQSAASSRHWAVQRRCLERLPEHAANELVQLLLARQSPLQGSGSASGEQWVGGGGSGGGGGPPLRPATLELFRHCATRIELRGPAVTGEWLAALANFGHLDTLLLTGCSKLTAAALQSFVFYSSPPSLLRSANPNRLTPNAPGARPAGVASHSATLPTLPTPGEASTLVVTLGKAPSPLRSPQPPQPPLQLSSTRPSSTQPLSPLPRSASRSAPGPPVNVMISATANTAATATANVTPAAANLRHLDLKGCARLGDEALQLLAHLTQLQSLNISETGVQGAGLATLSALMGLTRLQAGGLKSVGDGVWVGLLSALTALRHLDLWGSDAGGSLQGGEELLLLLAAGLPQLRHLGAAWTAMATLPALPELQVLDLRHCKLCEVWWPGGQPSRLALRQLLLGGAVLSGPLAAATDPDSPAGMACLLRHSAATLEHLDLADVGCPEPWVAPIAALAADGGAAPRLTHLDLSHTAVRPEDLAYLQCAPGLTRLLVAGSKMGSTRCVAAALVAAGLPRLQELDLSSCSLTDAAVSWLQQLTSLTSLNLAANPDLSFAPTSSIPGRATLTSNHPNPPPLPPPALPDEALPDVWATALNNAPEDDGSGGGGGGGEGGPPHGTAADIAAVAASGSRRNRNEDNDGSCTGAACTSSGVSDDGSDSGVWTQLRRLNLLGTRISEAGLRALVTAAGGSGHGGGGLRRLEQLKAGSPGLTDSAAAVLAAAGLPSLHSLLLRDAPLTGHGALLLAAGLPSLRRLELQACWLVSEQDAIRLADVCGPSAIVIVNGKAAAATTAGTLAANAAAVATGPALSARAGAAGSTPWRDPAPAAAWRKGGDAAAAGSQRSRGDDGWGSTAVTSVEDLSEFDQRLRYDTRTLMRLAASPRVGGSDGGGGGEGVGGDGIGGGSGRILWADLPVGLRR